MAYELQKPLTDKQRADFIVEHNHVQGLKIQDTEKYLFALEPNEIMGEKEIEIDVPDYETVEEEYQENVLDENGNTVCETKTREIQKPIIIEVEETVTDENGNEEIVVTKVQSTHKETILIPYPIINPNYEQELATKERERISNLTCTKRVFALILQEFGITYSQLKELIATNEQAQLEWDLCIELQRSNPLLDLMATRLNITSETLDYIFKKANNEIPLKTVGE